VFWLQTALKNEKSGAARADSTRPSWAECGVFSLTGLGSDLLPVREIRDHSDHRSEQPAAAQEVRALEQGPPRVRNAAGSESMGL
jgi:hypothetical protein